MKSKAIKTVGIVVVGFLALIAIIGASLSPKSNLERSVVVNAWPTSSSRSTASKIFNKWSPWMEKDS